MTKKLFTLLLAFISINATCQTQWELLNPKPTYYTGRDVHFVSELTGYIINEKELLETQDAGETWTVKENIPGGTDIDFKSNIGIIVCSTGTVLKSVDSGNTWSTVNLGFTEGVSNSGIFNSVSVVDENNIIISTSDKIVTTIDGGVTWTSRPVPSIIIKKTYFTSALVGHAAGNEGKIKKTTDGGLTWYQTASSNTIPSNYFTIYFVNENLGFASKEHNDLMRTTDGGETWTLVEEQDAMFSFHFVSATRGYAVGEYGVVKKTTNGGASWTTLFSLPAYYQGTDMYGIYFTGNNVGYVTGLLGRIVKTTDGGNNWTTYSPTYGGVQKLSFPSATTGYALIGGICWKTNDQGDSWQQKAGVQSEYASAITIDFVNETTGYLLFGRSVFKSTDGAQTWVQTNNDNELLDEDLSSMDFINENIGYASGGYNSPGVFKTIDGGDTWQELSNYSFRDIQFVSENIGYAILYNTFYKTNDGGATWTTGLAAGLSAGKFHFIDENTGYVTVGTSQIYKTSNGGSTWQIKQAPGSGTDFNCIKFQTALKGYVISEYGNIYKTSNGGTTWTPAGGIYSISDIAFTEGYTFIAGSGGKILRTGTAILSTPENPVHLFNGITLYPNPSKGIFTLSSSKALEKITITDLTGRVVLTKPINLDATDIEIDLNGKETGIYLVTAILEDGTKSTKKIILE